MNLWLFFLLSFLLIPNSGQATGSLKAAHTEVSLVRGGTYSGQVQFGIEFKLEPHWHIYWKNPGESGAAPKFNFKSPEKIPHLIGWPAPERIRLGDLTNFGYSDRVILPFAVPVSGSGQLANIDVDLEWLACQIECVPGFGKLTARIQELGEERSLVVPHYPLPSTEERLAISARRNLDSGVVIEIKSRELDFNPTQFEVFPVDKQNFRSSLLETREEKGHWEIPVAWSANANRDLVSSPFLIRYQDSNVWKATEIELPLVLSFSLFGFIQILFFAFIGGVLLNFMPCVLPVLSIKIVSLLQEGETPHRMRRGAWLYAGGVIATFIVLASLLLILRASGESLGWGFHLQSPLFVAFLAVLFFVMGLNFLGVLEMGQGGLRLAGRLSMIPLFNTSFGAGVLATVAATPCTAPFMGTALGASLLLPAWGSLLVFSTLGVGMAAPFVLLCYSPRWLDKLPKPGAWMIRLKQGLAIPLFLTTVWLVWVLFQQFGIQLLPQSHSRLQWENFDSSKIEHLRIQGEPVFIDFTAAWCLSCQWNKKSVLETEKVEALFEKHKVRLFRGDWTEYDPKITEALKRYGRNSVPVYVYIPPGRAALLLPELLTYGSIETVFAAQK